MTRTLDVWLDRRLVEQLTLKERSELGLAFCEAENDPDLCIAMGRDEGTRPLGDGVAWHAMPP